MSEITLQSPERPRLEVDLDAYLPLFEDDTISEDDKRALLETLWSMIVSFIQLGWGIHPMQQALAVGSGGKTACGEIELSNADQRALSAPVLISRDHQLVGQFQTAAGLLPQKAIDS